MKPTTAAVILAFAALSTSLGAAGWAQETVGEAAGVRDGATVTVQSLAGRWAVMHILPTEESAETDRYVKEHIDATRMLAGVRVVFVRPGDAAAVRQWWSRFDAGRAMALADADGSIAAELSLKGGATAFPTMILLTPDGREASRAASGADGKSPSADDLKRLIDEATGSVPREHYNLRKGNRPAIEGHDVVAYFTQGRAVKGNADFQARYQGVAYHFTGAEHRDLFVSAPEKYLPTYGGWCASAMGAKGSKVEIDPTSFKVTDGRLFLFYKGVFVDALKDWNAHEREWMPAADANWNRLTGEPPAPPMR